MADGTKISWSDATWNPTVGCSVISPGCTNCYAMKLAGTRLRDHPSRAGLTTMTKAGPVWTGEVRFNEQWLDQPLHWRKPRMIFVVAHGDLFHKAVPDVLIDRVFAVMALCPRHTFQVLTKRPERMLRYLEGPWSGDGVGARVADATWALAKRRHDLPCPPTIIEVPVGPRLANGEPEFGWRRMFNLKAWPLPHVLIGTSIEDQRRADERRPHLAALAAAGWRTWASYEPALGPIDWNGWEFAKWTVSGGESGDGARPSHPDWHRATRDFCQAHGIAYHFKQWGEWRPATENETGAMLVSRSGGAARPHSNGIWASDARMIRVGKKTAGAILDGREWREFPA